ncbi:MAG TPA: DUF305 domain-containing protein [Acetobacteraceae bacterium]|nr:DUF305 domain-containing protein [Acetobacteraceae bacterium]
MKWVQYCAAVWFAVATPALAQTTPTMPGMQMGGAPAANETPSTKGFREAMTKMDQGMNVPYTGDADWDFVAGMIPHHQGAVDMARVELRYGKDPALKRLARDIIASQQRQIVFMRQWQAKHAK